MPRNGAERAALVLIAALTLFRLALIPASRLEFYVDEAQYWLWGQEMAAGAWSKPPMVGWLIRAANALTGSDAAWAARLPWPLVHGAAALAVMVLGRRLAGPRAGALAGAVYAALPAVSLGSLLISTDSPQMLALALFLLVWVALPGRGGAALAGAALAAGMWSKYAMLFPLPGLAVAAWIDPRWRRPWGQVALMLLVAAALFWPNVRWNLTHDLATVRHTAENADWQGALHVGGALRFMAEQFAVAGPLTFAAMLAAMVRRWPEGLRGLVPVTAAPLAIVTAQALQAEANANWAVGALVGGAVLAGAWLAPRPRWTLAALALNGALATGLPIIATIAPDLRRGGQPVLGRYVGNVAVADAALARAGTAPLIVASDRGLLAQLTWRARSTGAPQAVRAVPSPDGPVPSHYDMIYPLRSDRGPALWIGAAGEATPCAPAPTPLGAGEGELGRRPWQTALLDGPCLNRLRR